MYVFMIWMSVHDHFRYISVISCNTYQEDRMLLENQMISWIADRIDQLSTQTFENWSRSQQVQVNTSKSLEENFVW